MGGDGKRRRRKGKGRAGREKGKKGRGKWRGGKRERREGRGRLGEGRGRDPIPSRPPPNPYFWIRPCWCCVVLRSNNDFYYHGSCYSNLRYHLVSETKLVYGIGRDDAFTHNEFNPVKKKLDLKDEDNLLNAFQSFKLFSFVDNPQLQKLATKDIVTKNIEDALLMARQKGQDQLNQFVEERLLAGIDRMVSLRHIAKE